MSTIVHNDFAVSAYRSKLETNMAVWNASSNSALLISDQRMKGDSRTEKFWNDTMIVSGQDRASSGDRSRVEATQSEVNSIKVPITSPLMYEQINKLKRSGNSVEEWSSLMGSQYADHEMQFKVKAMVAGLKGALGSEVDAQKTDTALSVKSLTKTLQGFGDKSSNLNMLLMHSLAHYVLVDNAIDAKITGEAALVLYGGQAGTLGRSYIVTDEADLSASETAHTMFALQTGAGMVKSNSELPDFHIDKDSTKDNTEITFAGEGAFNLEIRGYKFTGAADPDLAALASTSNWAKQYDDIKSTAGMMLTVAP